MIEDGVINCNFRLLPKQICVWNRKRHDDAQAWLKSRRIATLNFTITFPTFNRAAVCRVQSKSCHNRNIKVLRVVVWGFRHGISLYLYLCISAVIVGWAILPIRYPLRTKQVNSSSINPSQSTIRRRHNLRSPADTHNVIDLQENCIGHNFNRPSRKQDARPSEDYQRYWCGMWPNARSHCKKPDTITRIITSKTLP